MSLEGLIAENELMRVALDTARIGLCVIASDGQIVILGGDVAGKLGVKDSQIVVGQHCRNLLVPGLLLSGGSDLLSLNADEASSEARLSRPDGTLSMLVFQARTITVGESERYRVISIIDVTDFGIIPDRFLELRRRLDALNSAVVMVDARLPDFPIIHVNKRFERLTGYPADFAVGRNCRFLQGEELDQPGAIILREAIKNRQACQVVMKNFRKDGTAFQNELFISPLFDKSGLLTHYIGVQRECNGRKMFASGIDFTS